MTSKPYLYWFLWLLRPMLSPVRPEGLGILCKRLGTKYQIEVCLLFAWEAEAPTAGCFFFGIIHGSSYRITM